MRRYWWILALVGVGFLLLSIGRDELSWAAPLEEAETVAAEPATATPMPTEAWVTATPDYDLSDMARVRRRTYTSPDRGRLVIPGCVALVA